MPTGLNVRDNIMKKFIILLVLMLIFSSCGFQRNTTADDSPMTKTLFELVGLHPYNYPIRITAAEDLDYIGTCVIKDKEIIKSIVDKLSERIYSEMDPSVSPMPGSSSMVLTLEYENGDKLSFCLGILTVDGVCYELQETDDINGMIINFGIESSQLSPR